MFIEQHYHAVIANLKEVIFQTNIDGNITALNPAWTAITGFSEQECLGQALWRFIHPDDRDIAQQQLQLVLLGAHQDCHFQVRYLTRDQGIGWIDMYACSLKDNDSTLKGIVGSFSDATEYKAQEQRLSVERAVTNVLAESVSLGEAIPKLLMAICQSLDWEYGELWMPTSGQDKPQCLESWCHSLNQASKDLALFDQSKTPNPSINELPIFELGAGFIDQIWGGDGLTWLTQLTPELTSSCPMRSAPTRTALSMPISDGHDHLGIMLFFKRAYHPIDKPLLKRLGLIGSQIGEFMMRIKAEKQLRHQHLLLQSELQEAAAYMRSLLPQPMTEGVAIAHQFIPSNQLGGDAFDYYWLDSDHLALFLLDVSGHGVRSTLLSVGVLNLLRNQSLPGANFYQPQTVLAGLNRSFQMSESGEDYFTIWYGVYNRAQRTLSYSSAGHPPALLFSSTATFQPLHSGGLPVGMLAEVTYPQETITIAPDSTLYLFSDGVYEITTADGQRWQFGQFTQLMQLYHQKRLRDLSKIFTEITRIQGQKTLEDDYSLIQADFIA
ncbi:MAG: SpoIIE family protein phosphatase [Thermosynechococcaceae cyanobacterium]